MKQKRERRVTPDRRATPRSGRRSSDNQDARDRGVKQLVDYQRTQKGKKPCERTVGGAGHIMVQPLNLLAREDFRTGDPGYVLGEGVRLGDGVRKLTGAGLPRGAIRVTALEDIEAWTNGHFHEATPTRGHCTS
jgi:hypothetical protein